MSMRLHVSVEGPEGPFELTQEGPGPIWLGREEDCAVRLAYINISRHHASLELVGDAVRVTDASSNGTLVDGAPLQREARLLPAGRGRLDIGPFRVFVRTEVISDRAPQALDRTGEAPCARVIAVGPPKGPRADHLAKTQAPERSDAATTTPMPESGPEPSSPENHGAIPEADAHADNTRSILAGPSADARRRIRRQLLDNLDLASLGSGAVDAETMRPKVVAALRRVVAEILPPGEGREALIRDLADEALGLGPLERLLADPEVSEIMVVDPNTIFVERRGRLEQTALRFTDDDAVRAVIERIVTPLGRRIDESTPLVDARLKDGSRVNAVIPPLALRGPCITIRKFAKKPLGMADLVRLGSMSPEMARFLERAVNVKKNIVISGGTGSGKTTLLNVLSGAIPEHERIVTVEDAAELRLQQPHVVALEARPPNLEGKGEYSIRDLVKNALRMRPDRIVVGECRGGEAIDMLQAMNTGHEGSLTTTHANSPREAVARIETLCLMAGLDLPVRAIRSQIASSIHLVVQQTRFSDGARRVTSIAEVTGVNDQGEVELRHIFEFKLRKGGAGASEGEFLASGFLPTFLDQFEVHGFFQEGPPL
jgi:pilus assembly protein CpaF